MDPDPTRSDTKKYDPYAPEVVRKMAVLALLCALGALGLAVLCGAVGFHSYEAYSRAVRQGEAIYANWLDAWLLENFGPFGVLIFDEGAAFLFVILGGFAATEWWVMRRGKYNAERDKKPAGLLMAIALVGAAGVLIVLAIVKLTVAFGHGGN